MTLKRAAVYARVSTWEQAQQGYSMEYQTKILPDFARAHGYLLDEEDIYAEVMSGANDERPVYNQMIALIIEGYYSAIFVVEKSRLSRTDSRIEEERVVKTLQRCGCVVVTPYTVYDPSSVDGEFVWDILSAVDRNERKKIKARNMRGRLAKVKKGLYGGGAPPTGYEWYWDRKTKQKKFRINEKMMAPVRLAFELAEQGVKLYQIAKILNEKGYKSVKNKRLRHYAIKYWLHNPHYAGYAHMGGGIYPKTSKRLIFEDNYFLEPVISKESFQKIQEILEKRGEEFISKRKPPRRHPLSEIIRCPNCNGPMSVDTHNIFSKNRWYYRCNSRYNSKYCLGELPKTVPYNKIHLAVIDILKQLSGFGYHDVPIEVLDEFQHHILYETKIQQLSEERLTNLKAICKQFLTTLHYHRSGTSHHNYQYAVTRFVTTKNEYYLVNPYGEIQRAIKDKSR
jgi:DNA invertase Pin-like site-specific DNA recombinase